MDVYQQQIARIRAARTIDEIRGIAREFSAQATGEGGILYSRPVGEVSSEVIAKALSAKTGDPIINETPRGRFLGKPEVELAIKDSAKRIFRAAGESAPAAESSATSLLYGDAKAMADSPVSLQNSLWGEASRDFARSLHGDVKVVASNANIERVFGKVELPEVLANPNVRTLGGQPIPSLKAAYAQGGADAVLPRVQAQFVEAVAKGVFVTGGNTGSAVAEVAVSREFAIAMKVEAAQLGKFASAVELASAGMAHAPTGIAPAAMATDATLGVEGAAVRGLSPGAAKFVKGAGAPGVALMAYDFATTGHQVLQLRAQGNATGAQSATTHWIGRNAGGVLGGFLAGAGYGALAGSETGPGALVTALGGGIIGAYAGEKWAQQRDNDRIYVQKDGDGNEWRRDPGDPQAKWMRSADTQRISVAAAEPAGRGAIDVNVAPTDAAGARGGPMQAQRYVAAGSLENRLNYQAANASYELGLANLPEPRDPFRLPPGRGDQASVGPGGGEWTRDPRTHAWSREVVLGYLEHGMKHSITETASPQRATQLEEQSRLVIAENAANTPAAIAARYRIAYDQFGWDKFGPVPEAIANAAAKPGTMLASDGHLYSRDGSGTWTTPGRLYGTNQAEGNVRLQLEATHASQFTGLAQMAEIADYARRNPVAPKDELHEMVAGLYKAANVPRTEAELDAATAAIRRSHERDGIVSGYSLKLLPDPATGRPGAGSAIASFCDDGKGDMMLKSVTQADAMRPARAMPEARDPLSSALVPATKISEGVRRALPGIDERDVTTLSFALDSQRIHDGLREINQVVRDPAGAKLFGVQDQALRTGPVDVHATLARSTEAVQGDWQIATNAASAQSVDPLAEARTRSV